MNISRFFIDRPIFAAVLSLFLFIAGLISVGELPISEYPKVTPPQVVVRAQYPGANPAVIAKTVAAPLEEQINGVEDMLYMSSRSTSDGEISINITFELGTDLNVAQQLIQNRVNQALPRLPAIVRQFGVTTVKSSSDLMMVVHILSPNERYDLLHLSNYTTLNIKDRLSRINGVGQVRVFGGSDYAMRIWLDPSKVAARGLNADDVVAAIREQNLQVAAGIIGAPPTSEGSQMQLNINMYGRLKTPEEFGDIIVKAGADGAITRLRDVGRIELGGSQYALRSMLDKQPAVALGIFQSSDANALEISNNVRSIMAQMKQDFPQGIDYQIVYDPTIFVRDSIKAVIYSLLEAVLLVVVVVVVFLQTWRASIIPLVAVPISIIGTFALMWMFGFSINVLTLFGLVLSIGIVVDDAIVVVENVERNIAAGLSPRDATYQAMREVSGPIIATSLVLIAVFVPIAFISGMSGQFYRQFALTIAISTVISTFNSLTLSPALSALLLKPKDALKDAPTRFLDHFFGGFFAWFNRYFSARSEAYSLRLSGMLKRRSRTMLLYGVCIGLTYLGFSQVPTGYIPMQDKQYLIAFAQLPDGASLDRTEEVMHRISDIALSTPGVKNAVALTGLSIAGFSRSSSAGVMFLPLDPFNERTSWSKSAMALSGQINAKFASIKDAFVLAVPPPSVRGLGTTGGFTLQLQDRMDLGDKKLAEVMDKIITKANQSPELARVFSGFQINVPQLKIDLNRTRAKQLGIPLTSIYSTLQVYLGSLYVNDFNLYGRTYRVIVQADKSYRDHADDIAQLKVRNVAGQMVPLGSVLTVSHSYGPERASRYNAFRTADINGGAAPGVSSGQAQDAITSIINDVLPKGMSYEWTGLVFQQQLAGNTAIWIFPLCVLFVFLVLAAQYESLMLPLAVIMIVPMALLSAIFGVWLVGGDNNIFTQIALLVLVGLACKNAILIVEFARELELGGRTPIQAALESARLRLRPILMTSFAFIMGVVPLVLSSGAGAEMRYAMGIAVFSGMLGVTFFGLLMTPVFYVALRMLTGKRLHSAIKPPIHSQDHSHE